MTATLPSFPYLSLHSTFFLLYYMLSKRKKQNAVRNETPTVRGLAADNNNMQSVLMGNMETI